MNKFMFAVENIITALGKGTSTIINRKNEKISRSLMLYHTINPNSPNYFTKMAQSNNRRK